VPANSTPNRQRNLSWGFWRCSLHALTDRRGPDHGPVALCSATAPQLAYLGFDDRTGLWYRLSRSMIMDTTDIALAIRSLHSLRIEIRRPGRFGRRDRQATGCPDPGTTADSKAPAVIVRGEGRILAARTWAAAYPLPSSLQPYTKPADRVLTGRGRTCGLYASGRPTAPAAGATALCRVHPGPSPS